MLDKISYGLGSIILLLISNYFIFIASIKKTYVDKETCNVVRELATQLNTECKEDITESRDDFKTFLADYQSSNAKMSKTLLAISVSIAKIEAKLNL